MTKSKPLYTGRLGKTIARRKMGLLADEADFIAEANRITDEMYSKLPDLFYAHGVEAGNWKALGLALAKAHVPGFKVADPAGRPTEWSKFHKAEFKLDVDAFIERTKPEKLSVVEAIKRVIRQDAWSEKTKKMTLSALEKHYYDADRRWCKVVQDARAYELIVPTN